MPYCLTFYADATEEITRVRDNLKECFPDAILNYHEEPKKSEDVVVIYDYELSLLFKTAAKETSNSVPKIVSEVAVHLNCMGQIFHYEIGFVNARVKRGLGLPMDLILGQR